MNVHLWAWIALVLGTVVIIAVDLLFISKGDKEMSLRSALIWTGVWLALGVSFAFVVGIAFDAKYATEYLSGFLLEYSLSMDNVFVFIVLFGFFVVPQAAKLRVLTIGILIALGHSVLAMSGEETLAQVYREIEHPKLKNLQRAGLIIVVYSILFTAGSALLAAMIIPDAERSQYFDNIIGGLGGELHLPRPLLFFLSVNKHLTQ